MYDEKVDFVKDIEIFSTDDEKLKIFAEVISSDPSRAILNLLFKHEMTANEIALKTGMSLQLVKYHLEKMKKIELISVSKVEKNSKSRDMNYYKAAKFAIVITPSEVTEKAKQSKLLQKSFNSIYRFFSSGIAAVASLFSLTVLTSEGKLLADIGNFFGIDKIQSTILPNTAEESLFLAKSKVDMVIANPGGGSGTPIFDSYTSVMPFTTGEFIITMLGIAVVGALLSLPFFIKSYNHSKMIKKHL